VKYLASYAHYFDLGNHSVLIPKLRLLGSTHAAGFGQGFNEAFAIVQGKNTYDIYDQGEYLNLNLIGLRGYSNFAFAALQAYVAGFDYNFPIARPFVGAHDTLPFFLKQIHGFVFADTAFIPNVSYSNFNNLYLPAFGGGISADTQLFIQVPVTVSLQVQNGTRKDIGGDTLFFFSLAGGSLF